MINISGRQLACYILDRIIKEEAYANLALDEAFKNHSATDEREKAFATELTYGVLRNLLKIDFYLGRLLSRPLTSLKITVQNTLRIGLYQLLFLPDIPVRAVCHSAVKEIKQTPYKGLAPLVNGVLRSFLRQRETLNLPEKAEEPLNFLALEYSHPLWLVEGWVRRFGYATTEKILQTNNQKPPLTLRVNQLQTEGTQLIREIKELGGHATQGRLLSETVLVESLPDSLENLPPFKKGHFFVQDESSMLVAHLMKPSPGEIIFDLCAAPGGKTTHIAELMKDQGAIFAVDQHPHKIGLIMENAQRLKLTIIKPVVGDARLVELPEAQTADGVLVDLPCSGTGVLRRRIDARYRRQREDIDRIVILQREILNHAAQMVKPGGRLIYSTCTLEAAENEEQIRWFLNAHPDYKVADYRRFLPPQIQERLFEPRQKWATILPTPEGGDGFFLCRLEKIR